MQVCSQGHPPYEGATCEPCLDAEMAIGPRVVRFVGVDTSTARARHDIDRAAFMALAGGADAVVVTPKASDR